MKRVLLLIFAVVFSINICCAADSQTIGYRMNFPIKVHIPEKNPKAYIVKSAFDEWYKKTNGKVNVEFLSDMREKAATLRFEFIDNFGDRRLGLTQNYGAGDIIAYTVITLSTTDVKTKLPLSDQTIYYIALHEIGHAFGLGHSQNPASVMYPEYNPLIKQSLLPEDLAIIKKLYKF